MDINLNKLGKRFRFEWIFRNLSFQISAGDHLSVTGSNGSGKSTLLKILSGYLSPSEGQINYTLAKNALDRDLVFRQVSYAAPYIDLIEEFTLEESIAFHCKFKTLIPEAEGKGIFDILQLPMARKKEVRNFSSGMKQRLKLVLAICSQAPLLLLDEPSTNLDKQGVKWYLDLIEKYCKNRTLIIASNVDQDYSFCSRTLEINDFKGQSSSHLSPFPGVIPE